MNQSKKPYIEPWELMLMLLILVFLLIVCLSYSAEREPSNPPVPIEKPVRLVIEFNSKEILTTAKDRIPQTNSYESNRTYKSNKDMIFYLASNSDIVVSVSGEVPIQTRNGLIKIDKGEQFTLTGSPIDYWRTPVTSLNNKKYFDVDKGTKRR